MRGLPLACFALAVAAFPALGQDALRGKRLYHDVGRLSGAGVSCIDCHGGLPGALHGLNRVAGDAEAVRYAIGAIEPMTPLRDMLSDQDMADIAAYVERPSVPSPDPRVTTSGPAAQPHASDRLEFSAPGATMGTIRLTNHGAVALRLDAPPELAGEHAVQFGISATSCAEGQILGQGESCTVTIVFRPEAGPGLRVAILGLAHDWVGAGENIALIGRAAP